MSGVFAGTSWEGVDSSKRRVGGAWWIWSMAVSVNAHQPPKRGERGDAIVGQYYEGIEGIDVASCRVGGGRGFDRSLDQDLRYLRRVAEVRTDRWDNAIVGLFCAPHTKVCFQGMRIAKRRE